MMPDPTVYTKFYSFVGALSILTGAMAAWWQRGSAAEDAVVADAADTVLDGLADADLSNRIDLATGRDIREQMTIAEAEELHRERELRRFGWGRN